MFIKDQRYLYTDSIKRFKEIMSFNIWFEGIRLRTNIRALDGEPCISITMGQGHYPTNSIIKQFTSLRRS